MELNLPCKICGSMAVFAGSKIGKFRSHEFRLYRCDACGFVFVGNPWLDYGRIYSEAYYRGEGADPLVDYCFELEHPKETVRQYEWQGIVDVVRSLMPLDSAIRWLDFGSGNGGLVRYTRATVGCSIWGYEHGWIREAAVAAGIPHLTDVELEAAQGSFDVITAIEVLEHLPEPLVQLKQIRSLLRPGGILFLTTGNVAPHRKKLVNWSYVVPEVHISFFEPRTLELALRNTGFTIEHPRFSAGFENIIRFKILKNLRMRRTSLMEGLLPWGLLARIADRRYGVSAQPAGRARETS